MLTKLDTNLKIKNYWYPKWFLLLIKIIFKLLSKLAT